MAGASKTIKRAPMPPMSANVLSAEATMSEESPLSRHAATLLEIAAGIPADEKVKRSTKSGYAIW